MAQGLGVEIQQAEEYKKTYGLTSDKLEGKVTAILNPVIKMVTEEIKKAIHFYKAEGKGDTPKSVIVSGGTAGMPDVIPLLTRELQLEVIMANPFANVVLDPKVVKNMANYAPLYSVSVGLAMKGG